MNAESKREREIKTVCLMIDLYCRKNHGKELCAECNELKEYAAERSRRCPFMEEKTFCSNCKVHCYRSEMREKFAKLCGFQVQG